MHLFSRLYSKLDQTNSTRDKVKILSNFFEKADFEDAAWTIYIIMGKQKKRLVKRSTLIKALEEVSGYETWIISDAYTTVGDFAETVSLLLGYDRATSELYKNNSIAYWMKKKIIPLIEQSEEEHLKKITQWWGTLSQLDCFVITKILTGGLRVGVSNNLLARALSESFKISKDIIIHRLMGNWKPTSDFFSMLIDPSNQSGRASLPYPFFLASPMQCSVSQLGSFKNFSVEWKWDGIRAQIIKRSESIIIWSRGEEIITDQYPEVLAEVLKLEDCVLDGEIVAWGKNILPFSELQRRLGRKKITKKVLDEIPVKFLAFDCLEFMGIDIRQESYERRRRKLQEIINQVNLSCLVLSPKVKASNWSDVAKARAKSRSRNVEGVMVKDKLSPYLTGRKKGFWWKWKVDPLTIDAVMIYAQAGSGRRASLFTDYTFAVLNREKQKNALLPIAKAYSGLSQTEIEELDKWIRKNTIEKFGPVRSVRPYQVFELSFDAISRSSRHKSGFALRFPRISRWRKDKRLEDADSIKSVNDIFSTYQS